MRSFLTAIRTGSLDRNFPSLNFQILLAKGASVKKADKKFGFHPLFLATKKGHVECVQILLEAIKSGESNLHTNKFTMCLSKPKLLNSTVNEADRSGKTPLMEASKQGFTNYLTLLIEYGAKVNAISAKGFTALMHACVAWHTDCVKHLLNHGARTDSVESNSKKHNGSSGIFEFLWPLRTVTMIPYLNYCHMEPT